jgi:hypothetical protein
MKKTILISGIIAALSYVVFLQFSSPAFYDPDSYYHIAVSGFIKNYGLHYPFHWTQFSIFRDSFSDKDLLFHLMNLPFLFLTNNLVAAGKYAFIFQAGLFFLVYLFVLRKYLPDYLAAAFLLLPLTSPTFTSYILQLRPATLANGLTVLGIYFLINKRTIGLFIVSLLYALAHISFFMLIVFAFTCEILRLSLNKEFFAKNIYAALAGIACGCLLHPNFPHNIFSQYLNGIVVPLYALNGTDLNFAGELYTLNTKSAVITNFTLFFSLYAALCAAFTAKRKISFATSAWFASTSIYLLLAFFGNRYWYPANALFFIFFASYANDWLKGRRLRELSGKIKLTVAAYFIAVLAFFPPGFKELTNFTKTFSARSIHFENTGSWMRDNIPAGQTIYHSYWDSSPYFICLNPKDNYLNTLDPMYMFCRYPREFQLLNELSLGRVDKPYEAIGKIFKCGYGYLDKTEPLYRQISEYPGRFKVLYEDGEGVVFQLR